MSKKLKAGVIGIGMISGGHTGSYKENPETELIAICDIDEKWLPVAKEQLGVKYAYTDYNELLANPEIDIVSICLPNMLHAPVTIAALNAGKHVLCEKPMAESAEMGRKMRDAELKSGKKLMISHNQRFGEDIQVMKALNDSGAFGDIYHVRVAWRRPLGMLPGPYTYRSDGQMYNRNWFNEKAKCGGVLRDLGSHMIDLTMYILGFPELEGAYAAAYRKWTPEVNAGDKGKYPFDSEDMVSGFVKFKGGLSIQVEFSFGSPISNESLITNIYGTKMGAERVGGVRLIKPTENGGFITEQADFAAFGAHPFRHPSWAFVDSVINDTPVPVPSDEGIKVLEVIDALYNSANNK